MFREVQRFLGESWADFQRQFAGSLRSDIPLLEKANRFLLDHGGKKVRPTFTLLVAKALSGRCDEQVIDCAVATELIHTASLLHDDVVDKAQTRRGVPTMASLYSPTTAVLLGDYWLSKAMALLVDIPDKRVLHIFCKCLGDLAEGEMIQQERAIKGDTTEEDYLNIIYHKTTSLFEAAMLAAAYGVDASVEEISCVQRYAYHVGQAFQMRDDMLDYSPDLSLGKPTGQDILERKITLPLLSLFACAPKSVSREIRRRMKNPDAEFVFDVFTQIARYHAMDYAQGRLEAEVNQAIEALAPLPGSQAKTHLENMAGQMAVRTA